MFANNAEERRSEMIVLRKWMLVPALFVVAGLVAAAAKLIYGEHILGVTDFVPWGILLSGYIFFAAAATGTGIVGSLGHVWGKHSFEILHRRSIFLSAALLVAAFGLIGIDAGNVFHMIYFLFSPNPTSGIWWMVFFYSLYLTMLLLEIFLIHVNKADHPILKPVGYASCFVKLAAVGNLGGVFGWLIARPHWYGIGSSLFLILTAILTGSAVLLLSLFFKWVREGKPTDSRELAGAFSGLLRILIPAAVISAAYVLTHVLWGLRSTDVERQGASLLLVSGPLALRFWLGEIALGFAIPIGLILWKGKQDFRMGAVAASLVIVGSFIGRLNYVLAGQMVPQIVVEGAQLPAFRFYQISLPEWALVLGAASASVLVFHLLESRYCQAPSAVKEPS